MARKQKELEEMKVENYATETPETELEMELEGSEAETAETAETEGSEETEGSGRANIVTSYSEDFKTVYIEVKDGSQGKRAFCVDDYPVDIQTRLTAFGLAKRLGSQGAATGKRGTDAEAAQDKTAEGLKEGKWTVRVEAEQKIAFSDLLANYAAIPDEEVERKKMAADFLRGFGIEISTPT